MFGCDTVLSFLIYNFQNNGALISVAESKWSRKGPTFKSKSLWFLIPVRENVYGCTNAV